MVLEHLDSRLLRYRHEECTFNLAACKICGMQDSSTAVSGLAAECESLLLSCEADSPVDEFSNPFRSLAYQFLHRPLVAQARSRHERIGEMEVG
jgi:hypothetical protein